MKISRKAEAQRTDSKHTSSDDTSPTSSIPRNLLRLSQGGCFKGPIFTTHSASTFFCCFEMPIFRAYGTGDPSSSLGGVSDRANFHAKPCFCLSSFFWCFELLIFTSFWEVGFFFKKKHLHFLEVPKFCKKRLCQPLGFFGKQANVGQTSGRRRARRATSGRRRADVGHVGRGTSGKRRANVGQVGRAEGGGN